MECLICYEEMTSKDMIVLACCHIFHSTCVVKLIQKRTRKCPICRSRITWNVPQIQKHIDLS